MKTFQTKAGTELPLQNLRGKDYLLVAHRLVWFREEHPEHSIQTSFVELGKDFAIARAVISRPDGVVLATAHKSEDVNGFTDFMEKAETGAIGRALAMIGYGTQFAPEFEEGDRIVDAPLAPKAPVSRVTPIGSRRDAQPGNGIPGHPNDGKWRFPDDSSKRMKTINDVTPWEHKSYITNIEKRQKAANEPLPTWWAEYLSLAEPIIAKWENDRGPAA